jgi:hypothetical protein
MASAGIVGSTGLVVSRAVPRPSKLKLTYTLLTKTKGSNILKTLLPLPELTSIVTVSRRAPGEASEKLHAIISPDTSTWATSLASYTPAPQVFFSGLGTTRADAGGVENQRKVDVDLNVSVARAAREAGARVYVLISAVGANAGSSVAYPRMKGELEDAVSKVGFEKTVLVRPGMILGDRKKSRFGEVVVGGLARVSGLVGLKDSWAQDADVIAKAAVKAGLMAAEGKAPAGDVWVVGPADIVKLGRTEWGRENR